MEGYSCSERESTPREALSILQQGCAAGDWTRSIVNAYVNLIGPINDIITSMVAFRENSIPFYFNGERYYSSKCLIASWQQFYDQTSYSFNTNLWIVIRPSDLVLVQLISSVLVKEGTKQAFFKIFRNNVDEL